MRHRIEKVNSLIKEEVSKILLREMEFPGMLVTVTEVETSKKMDKATIGISVLPQAKEAAALKTLSKGTNYIAHLLDEKIHLRPMPRIHFEIDRGLEKAANIEKILRDGKIS